MFRWGTIIFMIYNVIPHYITDITTNEMLVSMSTATLDEFYPAVAIACMMRIINEPSLAQFHLEAVSSINTIFMSLGNK